MWCIANPGAAIIPRLRVARSRSQENSQHSKKKKILTFNDKSEIERPRVCTEQGRAEMKYIAMLAPSRLVQIREQTAWLGCLMNVLQEGKPSLPSLHSNYIVVYPANECDV